MLTFCGGAHLGIHHRRLFVCRIGGPGWPDDHGLFKIRWGRLLIWLLVILETIFSQLDHVTILQKVLFDRLSVDLSTIGAAKILQEGIIENAYDRRMFAADG